MGNCLSQEDNITTTTTTKHVPKRLCQRSSSVPSASSSTRWARIRNSTRRSSANYDDAILHEQALAAAAAILIQQQQQQQGRNGSLSGFDRSSSLRYPVSNGNGNGNKKQVTLPRSCSSRTRSLTDPLLHPHQLLTQDSKLDGVETNHFVLIHGGGFGAWCWYKTIALLEEGGFKVSAIDLAGSGIHSFDTNGITSLSQYVKPLTEFLEKLADGEKVILVGHDFGGACISYAMELFPFKVSKAVYVAAIMLTNGQSALDIYSHQYAEQEEDLLQQAQIFLYANGNNNPPTSIDLDKSMLKELLFNQSPSKDIALALVSMRSIPFAPVLEKITLSDNKYGLVRRFYIETNEDNAIPTTYQEQMIKADPPEQVLRIKGADHSPFFSKPQALHKHLVEIAKIS